MSRTIGVTFAAVAALVAVVPASAAGSVFNSVSQPSVSAGASAAGTQYGGSGLYKSKRIVVPTLGLVVRPNGKVTARAGTGIRCHGRLWVPVFIRLSGSAQGNAITASGHTRLGRSTVRVNLTGTVDGANANGTLRIRGSGCRGWSVPFTLRTQSAPAGAAAVPPPSTNYMGLTSQAAGGVQLPIALTVTHTGKVWAMWDVSLSCRPGILGTSNVTPLTKIRADGTFLRKERFVVRYTHGLVDHYAVTLKGAFRADGVSGTLTMRMHRTQPGKRFRPCVSGTQAWAARG
jgi:hypothetical protein